MSNLLSEEYRSALRELIETKSDVVKLSRRYPYDDWYTVWEDYSTYSWRDYEVGRHLRGDVRRVRVDGWESLPSYSQYRVEMVEGTGCKLVVPEGAEVREVNYSLFEDTVSDNRETVGVNAWGGDSYSDTAIHCECGKYSGLMLRWEGSLMDAVKAILEIQGRSVTL